MDNVTDIKADFGKLLRSTRERLEISLRQMAKNIDVSATYLSKVEQGIWAPPSEGKVKLLASYLKLDEDTLIAKANKIPSDFKEIFTQQPKPVADFLRTAKGLSDEDWEDLRIQASLKKERA